MDLRKSNTTTREFYNGKHRFEHWYRDNQIYFITARCRGKFPAFESVEAKQIFWTQFEKYARQFGFDPWITSLMINHYHTIGYLRVGENLRKLMQRFHGSVAKLVNDLLDVRLVPFFIDSGQQNYFDGCLRDVLQLRRAYRYTYTQCVRHHVWNDPATYVHTRVGLDVEAAVRLAVERKALLEGVPYARYERNQR